jgi:hypothetical protein
MITITARIPVSLIERAEVLANEAGMSLNDLLVHALDRELGGGGDPMIRLLAALRTWVRNTFEAGFPVDVTLKTFQHLRADPVLWSAYEKCICDANGNLVPERRSGLHRRIGLLVKRVLKAEVVGRSLPLNVKEHLISSYALLQASGLQVTPGPSVNKT